MDQKEYLMQVYNLDRRIYLMNLELKEYKRLSLSVSGPVYGEERVDHTPDRRAPFEKWVLKALDKEKEIQDAMKELDIIKADVLESIEEVGNQEYRMILRYRYIQSMNLPKIADTLYVSMSTLKRWHKEAVESIVVPEKYAKA